jgi:hypothetical protein
MKDFIHQSVHPDQVAQMQIEMPNAFPEQASDCLAMFWEEKGATEATKVCLINSCRPGSELVAMYGSQCCHDKLGQSLAEALQLHSS